MGADTDGSHLLVLLVIDRLREDLVTSLRTKLLSDLLMDQITRLYSTIDGVLRVRPRRPAGQGVNQDLNPDYLIVLPPPQKTNERNYLRRNEKRKKSWIRLKRKKRD